MVPAAQIIRYTKTIIILMVIGSFLGFVATVLNFQFLEAISWFVATASLVVWPYAACLLCEEKTPLFTRVFFWLAIGGLTFVAWRTMPIGGYVMEEGQAIEMVTDLSVILAVAAWIYFPIRLARHITSEPFSSVTWFVAFASALYWPFRSKWILGHLKFPS